MVTRTKKIFVGGLSAPSTLDDVKNYFEQFGRVSLQIIANIFVKWLNRHLNYISASKYKFSKYSHNEKCSTQELEINFKVRVNFVPHPKRQTRLFIHSLVQFRS